MPPADGATSGRPRAVRGPPGPPGCWAQSRIDDERSSVPTPRPHLMTRAVTFAVLLVTLFAAHQLADHVLGQTDAQARLKTTPGPAGWAALGRHLAAYHAVIVVMVTVAGIGLDLRLSAPGAVAGLTISVVTHALWDRRSAVRWLLTRTGGGDFAELAENGMNGMYLADQSLHAASLWLAALVAVLL
ncbi:DUF3307 domain-containing protein [Frankia sp. AiPs1]|nr:DUF3307 domain-containing protein [Frankia sp. AiPs1]